MQFIALFHLIHHIYFFICILASSGHLSDWNEAIEVSMFKFNKWLTTVALVEMC